MSSFGIVIKGVKNEADNFESISNKLEKYYDSIDNIRKNLSDVLGSGYSSINSTLGTVMEQIQQEQKSCLSMSMNLEAIAQTYKDTEKGLISHYMIQPIMDVEEEIGNDIFDKITSTLKEFEDTLKQLAKKLGLSFMETIAFINDLIKLIGRAGFEALFGNDTDWEAWFMKYVPENASDYTILGIMSLLSVMGMSGSVAEEHKEKNEEAWKKYQEAHNNGKYIEKQSDMTGFQYGNHTGEYNTCEVIAVYNALQYLTEGNSPDDFPDLLKQFEQDGIIAFGELGTSPQAVDTYFEEKGYDTKMIAGNAISSSNLCDMSKNYDTYIMTTYNDKSDLSSMVHTVSITEEDGVYVIHNDYEGTKSYDSLEEAVEGYKDGVSEPISIIGIK